MPHLKQGILVVFEGIDGSGKTSLAKNLYATLLDTGFNALLTKEPGGSLLGKHLRTLLQEKTVPIDPKAEFLLFAADRAQHVNEVIMPALANNTLIISDRMADSSIAYQGYGRGLDIATIKIINTWAMNNIQPNLTFYLKIDVTTAQKRLLERGKVSAFDQESVTFFERLVNGFNDLYKDRNDVIIMDGTQNQQDLLQQTHEKLITWITQNNLITP